MSSPPDIDDLDIETIHLKLLKLGSYQNGSFLRRDAWKTIGDELVGQGYWTENHYAEDMSMHKMDFFHSENLKITKYVWDVLVDSGIVYVVNKIEKVYDGKKFVRTTYGIVEDPTPAHEIIGQKFSSLGKRKAKKLGKTVDRLIKNKILKDEAIAIVEDIIRVVNG